MESPLPLGIAGAMVALYFSGGSLDIMAAIGFIVVLGIIVDDPILKVETLIDFYRNMGMLKAEIKRRFSSNQSLKKEKFV